MPSRPWESLGLRPQDPLGPGGHYFFFNNALAGILIIIFHQNMNPFALGLRVGYGPQYEQFTLPIPTCWYHKSLVDSTQTLMDISEPMWTQRELQCEPVEYGSRWVCESWVCVGHVDFMSFLSISFILGSRCECIFWWNMGLKQVRHFRRRIEMFLQLWKMKDMDIYNQKLN